MYNNKKVKRSKKSSVYYSFCPRAGEVAQRQLSPSVLCRRSYSLCLFTPYSSSSVEASPSLRVSLWVYPRSVKYSGDGLCHLTLDTSGLSVYSFISAPVTVQVRCLSFFGVGNLGVDGTRPVATGFWTPPGPPGLSPPGVRKERPALDSRVV